MIRSAAICGQIQMIVGIVIITTKRLKTQVHKRGNYNITQNSLSIHSRKMTTDRLLLYFEL